MSANTYAGTMQYKLIYIYSAPIEDHKGCLKIGEHAFESASSPQQLPPNCEELNHHARARIRQQTGTYMGAYELLHTELAVKPVRLLDGTEMTAPFGDSAVHEVLDRSGYSRRRFFETGRPSEWFNVTLAPAIAAIRAVKDGRNVLTPAEKGEPEQPTLFDGEEDPAPVFPVIKLRDEQKDCIKKTKTVFRRSDKMLWDCKMRFGKTVTAYSLVKDVGYQKVLVVTHRPAVVDGWQSDFNLIFQGEDRVFLTKANIKTADRFTAADASIDAENDRKLNNLAQSGKPFVYFASMQDLRGSKLVGGNFEKNRAVFSMDWDLIIYDEAHEGTQTELGQAVQTKLEESANGRAPKKVLQLSGTPYNLLNQYEDDNVYSWDYVMEQRKKREWADQHPGDHNPYADLPELRICTFDLRDKLRTSYRYEDENVAFNFREFFRTWTGDIKRDFRPVPADASVGSFVHEADVRAFLDLISTDSENSNYPFATQEYREMFKHTFWILPGVKEARAFSALLQTHPVFGFGKYKIVNVAGEGDVEMPYDDALALVRSAINNGEGKGTITLSCGKLTTGVTVKEWSGVMLLSGSANTGAAGYMQTIFRVQSAGNIDGKQKQVCYAFDFAPDRALKVISEVHQLKKSAVGTDHAGRVQLGEFLNFCPVLAEGETGMEPYDVPKMMREIKRLTVDAAVKSGFDDDSIYKMDAGIVMDKEKAALIEALRARLTPQKKSQKNSKVKVNDQGLTDEEYKKAQEAKRKPKRERTPEEKAALEKEKKQKKEQQALFALLRNISIRLPLLIYGTAQDFDESIRLIDFVDIVDAASWKEFMPDEVSKDLFKRLLTFYDEDVIEGAGMRIRRMAKAADELMPTQRVIRIAEIFSYFRNPAKETVLTPWRVVNMHLGDMIGGYNFYKEGYPETDGLLEEPRLIDRGQVTDDLFLNENVRILEMNSKSGLYPLYVAYSIYRILLPKPEQEMSLEEAQAVWDKVLDEHLFVLCQTRMAKYITKRTLAGYRHVSVSAIFMPRLLERMQSQSRLANKILNPDIWGKEGEKLVFDAVVGNPPYQEMDGGSKASAVPVYHHFIRQAKSLDPRYISMIVPAKWYSAGRGLDTFREEMMSDHRFFRIVDYSNSQTLFPTVDIAGGLCYFLWDSKHDGKCLFKNADMKGSPEIMRYLDEHQILIRNNAAIPIVEKIKAFSEATLSSMVSKQRPFGLRTYVQPDISGDYILRWSGGLGPIAGDKITAGKEMVDKWKVMISYLTAEHAGQPDKEGKYRVLSTNEILPPNTICTETYLIAGSFKSEPEAHNYLKYLRTKFVRFLVLQIAVSQHLSQASFAFVPIQDFTMLWTDQMLYEKYGLAPNEIDLIETTIKPMNNVEVEGIEDTE